MNFLVVPTIREKNISKFLADWSKENWQIIVVEDNPKQSFRLSSAYHYSWKEIKEILGDKDWIISKRDSAIRSFGFLIAYHLGAKYIFTLDDDCEPLNGFFAQEHISSLEKVPKWIKTVEGTRTRGLPYGDWGNLSNVVLNMGLWTGIPDYDAIQVLGNEERCIELPKSNKLIPKNQYISLCGMNLCFKKEITPLMYFPLMGEGYPYKRFDDIWCGIIMKKVCDHLNLSISVGNPIICHCKASDAYENLVKEAPGIGFNNKFWKIIDNITLNENSIEECMLEIGRSLIKESDEYLIKLGKAIEIWISCFSNLKV